MRRLRDSRPSYTTVAAYLAIFLALTGGAYAAATIDSGDVVNNSLRSRDLKNGQGVKGRDVRNGAIGGGDVLNRQLRGAHVVDESLGGGDVNEPSLALSQRVAQLGGVTNYALPTPIVLAFPNNSYTQVGAESNVWIAGGKVTFSAACVQPRNAVIYLFADDTAPVSDNIAGFAQVVDTSAGATTRRFAFNTFPGNSKGLTQIRPGSDAPHTFYTYGGASCNSGAGVTLDSIGVDVVAER